MVVATTLQAVDAQLTVTQTGGAADVILVVLVQRLGGMSPREVLAVLRRQDEPGQGAVSVGGDIVTSGRVCA